VPVYLGSGDGHEQITGHYLTGVKGKPTHLTTLHPAGNGQWRNAIDELSELHGNQVAIISEKGISPGPIISWEYDDF
jgi:hypothetical protein